MNSPSTLAIPKSVDHAISRYRTRKTVLRAGAWLGLGLTVGATLFIAALVADRFVDMPAATRLGITILTFGAPLILFLIGMSTLFRQSSAETLAGEIDDSIPGARDLLRSSVNLGVNSPASVGADRQFMLGQTFDQANSVGQGVDPGRILGWGRVPVAFLGLVILIPGVVVLFQSPVMDAGLLLTRFLHPMGNLPRPSLAKVDVDFPDVKTIQQGDDVTILASLSGKVPQDPHVGIDIVTTNPSVPARASTIIMTPRPGNAFEATLKNVSEPVTFTIWAADGRSERHTIAVTPRPAVVSLIAYYASPSYAQMPPTQGPIQLREIKALEGTRVRIEFESSIPVAESKVIFPDRQIPIRWDVNRTKGVFQFTIEKETTFNIHLVSDTGSDNHNEGPYRVRIIPDNPPTVSLLGVPDNLTYFRDDVINLAYKGSDDFGVSDVFIRYRVSGLSAPSRDYSLQSVVGAVREVGADFSLAFRDLTTEETDWIEIELVMVDTKGQEGVSPPVRFQIVSNTPDRQLQELIGFQERYSGLVGRSTGNLKSSAFRLGVLVEGMDANDKLSGSRKETFDEISRELSSASFPVAADDTNYFRMLPVSEYPYLVQRRTHDLFSRFAAIPDQSTFNPMLDAAAKSASPRAELLKLKAALDTALPQAQTLNSSLRSLQAETSLTLIDFVATEYMIAEASDLSRAAGNANGNARKGAAPSPGEPSAEALVLHREKQESRLKVILDTLKGIDTQGEIQKIADAIKSAAALPADTRTKALSDAIGALRQRLDNNGELDGRLSATLESYMRQNPWPAVFQQAAKSQSLPKASIAVSSWTRLARNSTIFSTPQAFLACAAQQAAQRATSSDDARLTQTLASAAAMADWSRQGDLYERVLLLRRSLANLDIESRVGRLNPSNPAFDVAWRQIREIYLSLTADTVAGRFDGMSAPVAQGLASLIAGRAGFASWNWHDAIGSAAWPDNRAAAMKTLSDLSEALAPGVRDGRVAASALCNNMLADLDQNLVNEHSLIAPELALIQADVDAAALAPANENNTVTTDGKVLGRRANPGRVRFTKALSERFSAYSTAIAVINDLRQSTWADHPSADTLPELQDLAVLYEFISNLDEEVYDSTYAIHLQQILRTRRYPQFVEETGRYMNNLTVPVGVIHTAIHRLLAGEAAKLAADDQFMGLPMSINKQVRFNAHLKSLSQQLEFTQAFQPALPDKARLAMFQAMSQNTKVLTPYWDQFYLACQSLHRMTAPRGPKSADPGAAARPADPAQWAGVDSATLSQCATLVARIRSMLPTAQAQTDESKAINTFLDDFPTIQSRVEASKVAAMSPAARSDAFELFDEWRGKVQAATQVMETRVLIPPLKQRPRGRLLSSRADLDNIISRLVRSEAEWTERILIAERTTLGTRAQLLVPPDTDPPTLEDLAFDFAREGQIRRRSAAALSQSSRDINFDSGGVDEKFLKMPKYLYDELVKAAKKPYPNQFEESGKTYTQGLFKDAR